MAVLYILYSEKLDLYYTGNCLSFETRFENHLNKSFSKSYTTNANDWKPVLIIEDLEYKQARFIERHIKRMKSKDFILNLKKYPELTIKLIHLYK